ncbi:ATP-grasp domain-containing protein [Flavobacteriaceae bacterium]|nr:ATP-grasp domain-containing protein [Flavobacteriaceae bacterium]|tara:strand:- start:1223 stop:2191 length:969 start_codon:yes stop_codon:yes gene_type:complete
MKNIAVVFGGYSSEYDVSVKSAKFIYDNLKDNSDWNIYEICISKKEKTVKFKERIFDLDYQNFSFEIDGIIIKPDAVFNIIHGDPGENGVLAEILEKNQIPQTGCDNYVSQLTFNKKKFIEFVDNLDIPCAKQILLKKKEMIDIEKIIETIKLPCIVKPNNGGSSIGVSKVNYIDELENKIKIAFNEDNQVLIETFLEGQEVSVGVINRNGKRIILPITEIISENELFDYNAKYLGESQEITPGNISKESEALIHKYIAKIYDNIELNGITRSEFIIVNQIPHILETNTIPGFTKQSIIPQQIEVQKLSVKEVLCNQIKSIL